jgi:hypothetical protein
MFGGIICGNLTVESVVKCVGAVVEGIGGFDDFASDDAG